ncbi:unnamed protein product, partial [Brenthis ino]
MLHMSRRTLERPLKAARECLTRDYVPIHLGWDHITREQVVEKNLFIANALFGGNSGDAMKAIIVCDGPYAATTSDATILSGMLNAENSVFNWFFRPGFQIEHAVLRQETNICKKGLSEIDSSSTTPMHTLEDYRMTPSSSVIIGTNIAASHFEPVASTSADLTFKPETTILKDIVAVKQSLKFKRKGK